MSDTDDTDDLLLIPPDSFTSNPEIDHLYTSQAYFGQNFEILTGILHQVQGLENRIHYIENTSQDTSEAFEDSFALMSGGIRRFGSADGLYQPSSTQSTPQKPHTRSKLHSLPASPNLMRLSPRKTHRDRRKEKPINDEIRDSLKNSSTISEIDSFLSKIRAAERETERFDVVRKLEDEFTLQSSKDTESSNKESNSVAPEPIVNKVKAWKCGENIESVPEYNAGLRQAFYDSSTINSNKPVTTIFKATKCSNEHGDLPRTGLDSTLSDSSGTEATEATTVNLNLAPSLAVKGDHVCYHSPIHSQAIKVLSKHKQLAAESLSEEDIEKYVNGEVSSHTAGDSNLEFMSLADIWASNANQRKVNDMNKDQITQKFMEEKLRRQHCEEIIRGFERRNLELQEKVVVALKVDESKSKSIAEFKEALSKIARKYDNINKDKQCRDKEIAKIRNMMSIELEEANKKVSYYEKDASRAINQAHSSQEKVEALEKRCSELENELKCLETKYLVVRENCNKEFEKNKQLATIVSEKEIELNENRKILSGARLEISQSKQAVESCQSEFSLLKNDCERMETDLKGLNKQIKDLTEHSKNQAQEIEIYKNNEKHFRGTIDQHTGQMEKSKIELRNFYQGQVEILVQNKLKEFQGQLDQAEKTLKEDMKKQEMSIIKKAASQVQQVNEKFKLEIKLLEEKHSEEMRLKDVQILQYIQQNEELYAKFESKGERIAKQFQKMMELEWKDAIKKMASGSSPIPEASNAIDQLNSLKTKSYNNLEEVFMKELKGGFNDAPKSKYQYDIHSSTKNGEHFSLPEQDFNVASGDTPVTSRHDSNKNNEIQKYIQMLLKCQPGNPTEVKEIEKLVGHLNKLATNEGVKSRKSKQ